MNVRNNPKGNKNQNKLKVAMIIQTLKLQEKHNHICPNTRK